MDFGWLKRMMPRGLYGRAALILLVPIITLQLVVSAAILQRYFAEVAEQLSASAALDIALVLARIDAGEPADEIAEALELIIDRDVAPPFEDTRVFYDLAGIEAIHTLRENLPSLLAVDLRADDRLPMIILDSGEGPVGLSVQRNRLSASNPHQLLVLMIFTGLLMTYVAYLFLRNQLRPIRRLADAAEAFGKGRVEDYSPSGAVEVRSAGRAFLDMRGRIESMIEQRTLMLSGVSHDLRTPLTRMKLGLSMQETTPEIEALNRDVEEMETLLTTFLDFARGEALDDPEPCDPVALARRIVDNALRAGGDAVLEAPNEGELVQLRPQAVHRALTNMVSNALRYGDRARVTVAMPERALRFTVEDDGPGIPPDQREDALRPFLRLDAARNQDKGSGVGLGLAIARDIARRHGGSLALGESAALGGLRIDLVLPR